MTRTRTALPERALPGLHAYVVDLVKGWFGNRSPSVLDLGSGSGAFLARLSDAGFDRLAGWERDISAASPLYAVPLQNVDLDRIDVDQLQKLGIEPSEPFDLITCLEVIEHLEAPGIIFRLASRLLSSQGILILSTPNIESCQARLRAFLKGAGTPFFDELCDPTHLFPLTRMAALRCCQRYDLMVLRVLPYPADASNVFCFSRGIRALTWLSHAFIPDPYPGDCTIYLIGRTELHPQAN